MFERKKSLPAFLEDCELSRESRHAAKQIGKSTQQVITDLGDVDMGETHNMIFAGLAYEVFLQDYRELNQPAQNHKKTLDAFSYLETHKLLHKSVLLQTYNFFGDSIQTTAHVRKFSYLLDDNKKDFQELLQSHKDFKNGQQTQRALNFTARTILPRVIGRCETAKAA